MARRYTITTQATHTTVRKLPRRGVWAILLAIWLLAMLTQPNWWVRAVAVAFIALVAVGYAIQAHQKTAGGAPPKQK